MHKHTRYTKCDNRKDITMINKGGNKHMTNGICECLNNEEKIILLTCLESNKKKISRDIDNQIEIKEIHKMRDTLHKIDETIDKVMRIRLC